MVAGGSAPNVTPSVLEARERVDRGWVPGASESRRTSGRDGPIVGSVEPVEVRSGGRGGEGGRIGDSRPPITWLRES